MCPEPSLASPSPLRAGDLVELDIERLAHGGDGVALHHGLVVFVPLTAPGDRVQARVIRCRGNHARAQLERVLRPSRDRRTPPCRHFGTCGGCQLQHMEYSAQRAAKATIVREALRRIAGVDSGDIVVHAADEFGYRNRTRLATDRSRCPPVVGLRRSESHVVESIESCAVLVPPLAAALAHLRVMASRGYRLPPELELTSGDRGEVAAGIDLPGFASTVERRIGDAAYRASATSFFQGNDQLVAQLVAAATETPLAAAPAAAPPVVAGEATPAPPPSSAEGATSRAALGSVIELYCGVGLFTVPLARRAARVEAVEASPQAVALARENLARNAVDNVELHRARADEWLRTHAERLSGSVDLVLLDPPRAGARETIPALLAIAPTRIRYVSCDPATLARDLVPLLSGSGVRYEVEHVRAFDLFPQTFHVEVLVSLARVRRG